MPAALRQDLASFVKAYDVRGTVPDQMNAEVAHAFGVAFARFAAEQGKEVFAIPGSIHSPHARGCHALLRQGAKLVESAQDVLEDLRFVLPAVPALPAAAIDRMPFVLYRVAKPFFSVTLERLPPRLMLMTGALTSLAAHSMPARVADQKQP